MYRGAELSAGGLAALWYAEHGVPVFPCKPTKAPYIKGGFKEATTAADVVAGWWKTWPDALIGMPTGKASGVAVLDLDVKQGKDGRNGVPDWESRSPVIARTKSGGIHLYFRNNDRVKSQADQIALGVDTRGNGGYVIVPPSAGYAFIKGDLSDRAALPPWPEDMFPKKRGLRGSTAQG